MPDKIMPGPVADCSGICEAVCVHTRKIMDTCRSKDCIEDLRVYLTKSAQCAMDRACSVKAGSAELLFVDTNVESVSFNKGFYTVDVRYYYKITADAFVGAARPVEVSGLAVFDKRVILFGSEGSSKTFTSDMVLDCADLPKVNQPLAVVEAVDPLVLGMKLAEPCDCKCCDCELCDVPACICSCFGSDLDFSCEGKRLYVSLGQFSLVRLERDTQLLIPVYDYCMPEKECTCEAGQCEEDPCELFRHVKFPVNEFFPPNKAEGGNSQCRGCC